MKSVVCVLLFALVATSMGMTLFDKYPINYSRGILNLFTQVQEQLKTGGPLDSIFQILDDEKAAIINEQEAHDLLHQSQTEQCSAEIDFRTAEVADGQSAWTAASGQKDRCTQNLQSAQTGLEAAQDVLFNAQNNLGALNDFRQQQVALFQQRVQDYNDAVEAIDEALAMIDEMLTGASAWSSLAQMSSKMLKHAVKLRHTKYYAGVIAVFAQLSAKQVIADEAAVQKVIDLLNNLKNNLNNSNDDFVNQENLDKQDYEDKSAALQNIIDSTQQQIADLQQEIADNEICIQQQQAIMDEAQSKVDRNQALLQDAQNMCENSDNQYNQLTEARNQELDLIEQIRGIIQSRFDELSEQVYSRGTESADEWAAYQNAYVYNLLQKRKNKQK